jgi:hypothetical protein
MQSVSATGNVFLNKAYVKFISNERLGIDSIVPVGTRNYLSGTMKTKTSFSKISLEIVSGYTCHQSTEIKTKGYDFNFDNFNKAFTFSKLSIGDYSLDVFGHYKNNSVKLLSIPFSVALTEEQSAIVNDFYGYMLEKLFEIISVSNNVSPEHAFTYFIENVSPGEAWDIKITLGTECTYTLPYIDHPVTGEDMGNILYGFAGGYLYDIRDLLKGGEMAAGYTGKKITEFYAGTPLEIITKGYDYLYAAYGYFFGGLDSDRDQENIQLGYDMYVLYLNGVDWSLNSDTAEVPDVVNNYEEVTDVSVYEPYTTPSLDYYIGDVVYISGMVYANSDGSGRQVYKGPDHGVIITDINYGAPYPIGFKYPGTSIPRYGWISVDCIHR